MHLVEITAYSDDDAYTIFETMNDRGLSLTPTDMLKGYLLANITRRVTTALRANALWKERIARARRSSARTKMPTPSRRGCAASTPRPSVSARRGAEPEDFDLIGTEFHRWVRDHDERARAHRQRRLRRFVERDFRFYTRQYERLREARTTP